MSDFFTQSAWLIPCYPLVGMVLSVFWFPSIIRRTGPRPAGYVNVLMTGLAFLHALAALVGIDEPLAVELTWLQVADLHITLPLEVSALTLGAIAVVTSINLLAQVYAIGYLEMDWGWARFFALLALFEAGMCGLVLCDSLFFSYVILEVLTLGTYLLVGFWFNQPLVVTGARDAFLTKRVGDLLLLMGVLAIYPLAGTWNFDELTIWAQTAEATPAASLVGLALLAGPMGKCAQFPLHLWLDEAMEGPYPSTVLRNSVVVATGAWVLVKLEPVLAMSPLVLSVATAIGAATALGATCIAIAQIDVKRALSYLTSAYMGIVFVAVGAQETEAAFVLLLVHALATAALVTSTGSIVLNTITQDLTQLGGLWSRRPVSGLSFLAGACGLVALPPLGGFWGLLATLDGIWTTRPALAILLLSVNALAAFGLARVFCLIFAGRPQPMAARAPENLWAVTMPMAIAAGLTLHLPLMMQAAGLLPTELVLEPALWLAGTSVAGGSVGCLVYLRAPKPVRLPLGGLQDLLAHDFYTPRLYRASIVGGVDWLSRLVDWGDRHLIDGAVNLVGLTSIFGGQALKYGNSGKTQFYILTIAVALTAMLLWMNWSVLSDFAASIGR